MNTGKIEDVLRHYTNFTSAEDVITTAFANGEDSIDVCMSFHGGREAVKELAGFFHHGFFVKPDGYYKVSNIAASPRKEGLSCFDFTLTLGKPDLAAPPARILVY